MQQSNLNDNCVVATNRKALFQGFGNPQFIGLVYRGWFTPDVLVRWGRGKFCLFRHCRVHLFDMDDGWCGCVQIL